MKNPNIIVLMKPKQFNSYIHKGMKRIGWKRVIVSGKETYERRTWKELCQTAKYINNFGAAIRVKDAVLNGKLIGTVWVVKLHMKLEDGAISLEHHRTRHLLALSSLQAFLNENP